MQGVMLVPNGFEGVAQVEKSDVTGIEFYQIIY